MVKTKTKNKKKTVTYERRVHLIHLFLLPHLSQIQDVHRHFLSERRAFRRTARRSVLGVVLEP